MRAPEAIRRAFVRCGAGVALLVLALPGLAAGQPPQNRLLRFTAVIDAPIESSLRWPVGVAAGPLDEVAVADAWKNRLLVFRRIGAGWSTAHEVVLPAPPAAVAYAGGRYLVALRGLSRLTAVTAGATNASTQEIALPDGLLPGRLAAAGADLLLWDSRLGRVVKLREGAIVAQVAIDRTVTALADDGSGGFWVGIGETGELRRHDTSGALLVTWRLPAEDRVPAWPAGIASEPNGTLFVLDRHTHRVVVLDPGGRSIGVGSGKGSEPGQLRYPSGMAKLPGGGLLIGDGGNSRAQLFDVLGSGAG